MDVIRINDYLTAYYVSAPPEQAADGWVDLDMALGTLAYSVHRGSQAVVFDSLVLPEHGRALRSFLEHELSVSQITLLNSHWHLDHIGGNAAFADCKILASPLTREFLRHHQPAIAQGTLWGPPGLAPLILPEGCADYACLSMADLEIRLLPFDIHVPGSLALFLPGERILLAGDMLEDSLPVAHPDRVRTYIRELPHLLELRSAAIYPGHGAPEKINSGGYNDTLIRANLHYLETLLARYQEPGFADQPLSALLGPWIECGAVRPHTPYAAMHRRNVRELHEYYTANQN